MRHRAVRDRRLAESVLADVPFTFYFQRMDSHMTSDSTVAPDRRKGRAALGNPANRFERLASSAVDDDWDRDMHSGRNAEKDRHETMRRTGHG